MTIFFQYKSNTFLKKIYIKFILHLSLIIIFVSFPFNQVNLHAQNKQNIEIVSFSSAYKHKAWYVIEVGNVPVGVFTVGVENTKTGYPSDYYAQFMSRVGYSPFISIINGHLYKNNDNRIELVQKLLSKNESGIFQKSENKWLEEHNQLFAIHNKGATLQNLFPINFPKYDISNQISKNINIFYYKSTENSTDKILMPLTGTIDSISNLHIIYDIDNFLLSANLAIQENINLSFKRIKEREYTEFLKSLSESSIDFGWLAAIKSPNDEIERVTQALNTCMLQASAINKLVTKDIPQSSYLSYRKLINISRFCKNTNSLLLKAKTKNYYEKLNIISSQIKKLMRENQIELPVSITNSPELTIFYNDTISFLWPRVISLLIHNSIEEIHDNFLLEKNIKSLLGIQININSLQPRSVVRSEIKLIEPLIVFNIEKNSSTNMSHNSLSSYEEILNSTLPSYLINGQYFSKNQDIDINYLCTKNKGKLGIDLGDAPQIIVNNGGIRGIWDTNTRVYVARVFALKTASTKSCRQIYFKIPEKMNLILQNVLENFKNRVISPDNEVLLSNNVQKKLLVMPGKYRMTTTSLVTGSVISTHEFYIDPGTNTTVTAKAN